MSAQTLPQLYTFEEFCAAIEDGQKADLIDGVIYMASPDSLRSNQLQTLIQFLMEGFSEERGGLGWSFVSRVALRLGVRNGPEPDVVFVTTKHQDRLRSAHIAGAADIVVEIVSDDSRSRDYVRKRVLYEDAGIAEYWIVNPATRETSFLRLRDGLYEDVKLDGSVFRSEVLSGFWLDVRWLFAEPLPKKSDCLRQILAGDPGMREGENA